MLILDDGFRDGDVKGDMVGVAGVRARTRGSTRGCLSRSIPVGMNAGVLPGGRATVGDGRGGGALIEGGATTLGAVTLVGGAPVASIFLCAGLGL